MTRIKIWKVDDEQNYNIIHTKNVLIKQVVYRYKKNNNIKYETQYEVLEDEAPSLFESAFATMKQSIEDDTKNINTAKNYITRIKKYVRTGRDPFDITQVEDYAKTLESSQRESFYYAMLKSIKTSDKTDEFKEDYIKKIKELVKIAKGIVVIDRAERTVKKTDSILTMADLKEKASEMFDNPTYKFIAQLYVMEVAWRADTVVHITKSKKKEFKNYNIIYPTKKQLVLNHYKTFPSQGQKIINMNDDVVKLIKKQFKRTGSDWLLPDPKDHTKPMNANTLTKILKIIFDVGVQQLRHIHLTEGRKNLDKEEFVKLCHRMNTSAYCGINIYNDLSLNECHR